MTYKILVKDDSGNNLGEFDVYRNLRFGKKLNDYGECSFEIPVDDSKADSLVALRRYSVWIYRVLDGEELLLWAGEQVTRQGSLDDKGDSWALITCYDWLEQLNSRYTDEEVTFTQIDAGAIAWSLINTTQGETDGDFGITEGTIEATQLRDRTYYNKNILEAIIELSNVINGFDFEINNSKVFSAKAVIGVDRSDEIVLEYGFNITSMRIVEDFSKIVNRAIVLGDSGVTLEPSRVDRNDTANQTLYKLREAVTNEISVSETETLEEKGDALNRKYATPLLKISHDMVRGMSPTIEDFALGDIIKLKIKRGIYNINENFRVFEWMVNFDTNDTERLELTLGNFYLPDFS